ncbi:MAG: hypothetical protein M1818_004267 [Claussenomyces sp. TS43310]|nr:MAG: hypothetical protein M1818_004267 [Claussenomyces sp. TS43310]
MSPLPDSKSPNLHLTHPTRQERIATWDLNFASWGGFLSQAGYIEREQYLMTVPLAKDGGVTHWILVDKNLLPNERPIYGSCESVRKRALIADKSGHVTEGITHGIGSVFSNPAYRGKGYASRMMQELGKMLRTWQATTKECHFTVLWSDIGKQYYARHGWHAFPSTHIEFPAGSDYKITAAQPLFSENIGRLCALDEAMLRKTLPGAQNGKLHVAIIPDLDQMQWHHMREDFLCDKMFQKRPKIRGAILGEAGHRMWAIWTRSFYGPLKPESGNALHILRLVIEDETHTADPAAQAENLKAILEVARSQAAEWKLLHVELWNPSPLVQDLVGRTGLKHGKVERDKESISSLMWYGEGSGKEDEIEWVGNEKFGWC